MKMFVKRSSSSNVLSTSLREKPQLDYITLPMAKQKEVRLSIVLECTQCVQLTSPIRSGVSRYTTQKNRRNTPGKLELKKFCRYCIAHTIHKEIKK